MTPWQVHVQPPRQGSSHAKSGVPCQDAAWTEKTEFAVTAALCDGLGSLEYSQIAARAAACAAARLVSSRISEILAERGCLFLREQELEALRRDVLAGAREAVSEEAERFGLSSSEMDCTLLLACLTLDGQWVLFGQLGDGAVCAIQKNRGVLLRARENPNRATSNETATVCSPDAEKWFGLQLFQFETAGRTLDGFLLTTDGLQNEIYSRAGNVLRRAEWYANAVSALGTDECTEAIAARWDTLASDERFGFTDDMSLIAVVRRGVVFELPEDVNWLCACARLCRLFGSIPRSGRACSCLLSGGLPRPGCVRRAPMRCAYARLCRLFGSVPRPNPEERRRPNRSLSLVRGCSVLPERRAPARAVVRGTSPCPHPPAAGTSAETAVRLYARSPLRRQAVRAYRLSRLLCAALRTD